MEPPLLGRGASDWYIASDTNQSGTSAWAWVDQTERVKLCERVENPNPVQTD